MGDDVHLGTRGKVSKVRGLPREKNGAWYGNVGDMPIDTIMVSALGGHHHFSWKAPVTHGTRGDLLDNDKFFAL